MDLDELVVVTALTCEELLKLIFRLFDRDMSGGLSFYEFVLAMYVDYVNYVNYVELC